MELGEHTPRIESVGQQAACLAGPSEMDGGLIVPAELVGERSRPQPRDGPGPAAREAPAGGLRGFDDAHIP